jgi:hypothetical protein
MNARCGLDKGTNNDLHTPTGHIAVGWLVIEDE